MGKRFGKFFKHISIPILILLGSVLNLPVSKKTMFICDL